jgi:ligand-binding sensor domain-containing protein/signal transduction histidine kinase
MMADKKYRVPRLAGSSRKRTIRHWLNIAHLIVSLAFSLHFAAGAEPKPLVAGRPIKLPLIEGKDIRFTHLSTEQGLSQSRVDHMLQDRRGFIWIGTYNGLNRYDGYRFKTYKPVPNNPNSLAGLFISALFEDRSGILWIGTDQGLNRFDPMAERFMLFRADPDNANGLSGFPEHITQDRDGMLWLATHNGLNRLNPASGRFTRYRNDPNDPNSLSSDDVRFVLEDRRGMLWVATAAGIDAFDRQTGRVLRYSNSEQPPFDRILEDRAGMLWVSATRRGGLASLDPKTGVFTRYTWFDDWPEPPGTRGCSGIHEDRHGTIWLATKPDGLVRFDRARRSFTRYRNNPANPASLNDNEDLSLLEDREGGIWVGTSVGGVNRFSSEPPPFMTYRREPGNPNSLAEGLLHSVFEDSQGILWIGTNQLNRVDRRTGRYTIYAHDPANPGSITTGVVYAMVEDRAGVLWFGTWGGGLNRFDRRTGRFKAYRNDPGDSASLSHDNILSLLVDRGGKLWAGTDDGLNRLDASTGRFSVFRPKSSLIESRWHRVLAEGADGSIWMGTYTQGLQRLDVRTGEIIAYRNDPEVLGSLSSNRVNALCVDQTGTLWVGTQDGLNRFDRNTGQFTIFGERDGLPDNAVEGILEDSAGRLWLSTGNGLSRFDPRARTFKNYYSEDGLAGDEFNYSVYYKSARGEMFFGGVNGVTAFFPEKVVDRPFVPPVVPTDFRLFNDPVPVGGKSPLKKSISYTDSVTLSHAQNIFALEFSALSFASPARTRYRYRLEGLETDWNEAPATHRVVTYTTLPAAEYRFRIQSKDSRGGWSEPGLTLAVHVLPAWWNTWQFRTVWITSLILLTWLVYQFRVRQHQQEFNMLLEGRVEERTRIARDLHDTLLQSFQGLILVFQTARNLLPGQSDRAAEVLDEGLHDAAEAIVEGRNAIQNLRAKPSVDRDLGSLFNAAGQELAQAPETEGSAPIFRVVVEGARQPLAPLLQDEIYRIGREVLRNAFRHAKAGRIEAEIRYERGTFRLRIRDDGKGIDSNVLKEGTRTGHWGLPGMHERAQRMGGRLKIWSEPGAGTEAELTVPARIAYEKFSTNNGWWTRLGRRLGLTAPNREA